MNSPTLKTRNFFHQLTTKNKCESSSQSTLTPLGSVSSSVWERLLGHVRMRVRSLSQRSVPQGTPTILAAFRQCLRRLFQNKRHLVGSILLVCAIVSLFVPQLFCDFWSRDHAVCRVMGFPVEQCDLRTGWCFINWFYYFFTIKWCLFVIFGSVAGILFIPTKYSLSFIPFSVAHSAGWVWIFHYSFYARSNETFHQLPHWQFIIIGLSLGFSIVMSADYLLYWWNHKALGNWTKFVGVAEMKGVSAEQKAAINETLAQDFRKIQKMI